MKRLVARYVGNRGIVLGLLGLIWFLRGFGTLLEPAPSLGLPVEHLPVWFQAGMWIVPGVLAMLAVALRRLDAWAWGLLITPVGIHFVSFTLAWVLGTYNGGWRGAMVFLAVAALINRCAAGLDRPAPWDGRERRAWIGPE
jgi:hypothetical protein